MHNEKERAQQQAAGLTEGLVRKLIDGKASRSRLRDLRNRALLVLGYVTMCRRSELVALRFEDLTVEPDGFGTVLIRRSKADQEGLGAIVPIPADAVRYLARWLDAARITAGSCLAGLQGHQLVGNDGPVIPASA